MKSPQECFEMLAAAYSTLDVDMTETIALIQSDARKQGMRDAREIVKLYPIPCSSVKGCTHNEMEIETIRAEERGESIAKQEILKLLSNAIPT